MFYNVIGCASPGECRNKFLNIKASSKASLAIFDQANRNKGINIKISTRTSLYYIYLAKQVYRNKVLNQ